MFHAKDRIDQSNRRSWPRGNIAPAVRCGHEATMPSAMRIDHHPPPDPALEDRVGEAGQVIERCPLDHGFEQAEIEVARQALPGLEAPLLGLVHGVDAE